MDFFRRNTDQFSGFFDQVDQPLISQAVIDIAAVPAGGHPPGITQDHQVLRNARLAQSKGGHQMANTGRLVLDDQKDLNPGRLAEEIKQF